MERRDNRFSTCDKISIIQFYIGLCFKEYINSYLEMDSIPGLRRSLEKEVETHSSIPTRKFTEESGRLRSMELKRVDMTERLTLSFSLL